MRLFKREGYDIVISDEAYALKPFRQLWNRDKSASKDRATMEMGYCYFMEDPRSDYAYIINKEDRAEAVKKGTGLKPDWKPDKLVMEAVEFFASFKTTSSLLLEDTRALVDGYRIKLRTMTEEMADMDVKEVKEIGAIIKQVPSMVTDLDTAERAITKEITQNDKVRGQQEKSVYEDM